MESINKIKQTIYTDYPEFKNKSDYLNDYGWDNLVLVADERVVFRIPRNELSRKQLQVELHFLPQIAAVSPLPVPEYTYFSKEEGLYAGYDLIPGVHFEQHIFNKCSREQRREFARALGKFLSALHKLEINESEISGLPMRYQNRQSWLAFQTEVLNQAEDVLTAIHKKKIQTLFDFIQNEIDFDALPKTLIHGDLSADHIIYDPDKNSLSGIIDFGDLMIGDPAYDFTGILMDYGREFLDEVLANYEPAMDENFPERIEKFYIPKVPLHQLLYGLMEGDEDIVNTALAGLAS